MPSLHGQEGSSLLDFVPSIDTVDSKSVMGTKPGDSSVSGYQVGEFTCTLLVELFVD